MSIPQADIEAARARVPVSEIARRHIMLKRIGQEQAGLCPFHNERSASFFVNDDKGFYHCFGCGAHGDQITLLMRLSSMSFNDAVAQLLGREPVHENSAVRFEDNFRKAAADYAAAPGGRWEPDPQQRKNMADARALFDAAQPAPRTLAESYLRARGITIAPPKCLRFAPRLAFWIPGKGADRAKIAGHHPALIAGVQGRNGDTIAAQRIYLNDAGTWKAEYEKPKKVLGPLHNGAVRLSLAGRILGIAEGVETGMAAMQLFSIPVWATLGNQRFTKIALPEVVEQLVIFADNGKDGRVDREAMKAAEEYDRRGIAVVIEAPEGVKDWCDHLNRARLTA